MQKTRPTSEQSKPRRLSQAFFLLPSGHEHICSRVLSNCADVYFRALKQCTAPRIVTEKFAVCPFVNTFALYFRAFASHAKISRSRVDFESARPIALAPSSFLRETRIADSRSVLRGEIDSSGRVDLGIAF